ncbi:MAG: RHS repeat protein [Deltaproteobacteria bacterium]|nr:RHS repeat protein [Deltaproteobacteria bacterium]
MARTAPAPNIPPIPGMCPSVAVMGGGGTAGGGSGSGAGSGEGGAGAGASGGESDAPEDGRDAPAGEPGTAAQSCPVDVVTGAMFTTTVSDFWLPGPLPVDFRRGYRTGAAEQSCGIGFGWSHAYAWRAEVHDRELLLRDDSGTETALPLPRDGQVVRLPFGRSLSRHGDEIVLGGREGLRRVLRREGGGLFLLAAVRDRCGNEVRVAWDGLGVCAIVDSVGRRAERRRDGTRLVWTAHAADAQGRSWSRHLCSYELDGRGDLVRAIDAAGFATEYAYDDEHYLVSERRPDGLLWRYRYEDVGLRRRCLETWGELEGRDVLAELGWTDAPRGRARPKGIFHTRFEYGPAPFETTVTDGVGALHRYQGNALGLVAKYVDPAGGVTTYAYDELGNMLATTDGLGQVEQCIYDDDGRMAAFTDPLGHTTRIERDAQGEVVAVADAMGGRWELLRDGRGKLVRRVDPGGAATEHAYDERGLCVRTTGPAGATDRRTYDGHGNLVECATARGATWRYGYDLFGLPVRVVTPHGGEYRFGYDARGDIVTVDAPAGQRTSYEPDCLRRPVSIVHPGGGVSRFRWVADVQVERSHPDGTSWRMGCDGLLRCRWVQNGAGERRSLEYDAAGSLAREVTFGGRIYGYVHDALGRCTAVVLPDGARALITRDAAGRIAAYEHPSGAVDRYDFDPLGRLVRATGGSAEIELEYDACGRPRRERQRAADWEFVVERSYDEAGRHVATGYSTGWSLAVRRDGYSLAEELRVRGEGGADEEVLQLDCDPAGAERRRVRPGRGHAIETERDELGRAARTRVLGDGGRLLRERRYSWAPQGPLGAVTDSERGTRSYRLDAVGRPLAVEGIGAEERFAYSPHGAPLPAGRERALGAGGRVLRDGEATLVWDEQGRLAQRRHPDPARSWRYHWGDADALVGAESGAGDELRFVYDAFGRRLAMARDGRVTWFGWDGERCVEEHGPDGATTRRVFADDGYSPLCECVGAGWRLLATDDAGTPWFLLGADGASGELDLTAWGEVASARGEQTLLRLAGQRADLETSLSYQNQRYYAPDLGLFIAPDPLGHDASPYDIGFVPNVTLYIDPLGLIIVVTSNDPARMQVAQARGAATGQSVVHHSSLGPGGLAGESHVELVTHGAPGSMELGSRMVSGREMGQFLQGAGFTGSSIDTRTVCNAGTRPSFIGTAAAQELADTTGATVDNAASAGWNPLSRRQGGAIAWAYSSGPQAGQTFIAGITTQQTPTGPQRVPGRRQGSYETFRPRP